ncbi:MAG TPA: pantoate--beta-alanine ligase [bacterium]|mgnify:FL=1|nr:pantoate--beta-alanine ligase [bacterium]HPP30228.1 pantoate--beta-alanine ligase [bacterium]
MKVVEKIDDVRKAVKEARAKGKIIGFVPTMGFLHYGHLSLIKKSVSECGFTTVSIFVNPTQFDNPDDYNRYPRDIKKDMELLKSEGVDIVFVPSIEEMYGEKAMTFVEVKGLSDVLEGKFRPGHFKGVCTVVCKLFNIIQPDRAYFGWKDAQQLVIIKKMVKDLNIPVDVIGCPTIREKDGLAASSRNIFIKEEDREKALSLYKALKKIEDMVLKEGIKETSILIEAGKNIVQKYPDVELQYIKIVEVTEFMPVKEINGKVIVLGAIKLPYVRLIDNIIIDAL